MEWSVLIDPAAEFVGGFLDTVFARDGRATVWQAVVYTFGAFAGMYAVMTSGFWAWSRHGTRLTVVDDRPLRPGQIRKEITASLVSVVMFALLAGMTFAALRSGWLAVEGAVSVPRWFLEVLALMVWNEVHFYAMHRLLHTKPLYRHVHAEHHQSIVVTPFAGWRFHWFEALLLGAVMPLAMIVHDFSVWSLLMLPPLSLFWNTVGHSNAMPQWPMLAWLAGASQRHAAHHRLVKGNYGFAMPYLDRWLGTRIA